MHTIYLLLTVNSLVFMIPSMKSSLGMRPSLFLSIFLNKSVSRDFLWFINFRNFRQKSKAINKTQNLNIQLLYLLIYFNIHLLVFSIDPTRSSLLSRLLSNNSDVPVDDAGVPKPSAIRYAICPKAVGNANYVIAALPLYYK